MSTPASIEQRLAAVEVAVHELQTAIAVRHPAPNWLERVIGSQKDEPAFDEVLGYGRAHRQGDPEKGAVP
jgi:hypothetical protein